MRYLLLFLFLITVSLVSAQNAKIDSLKKVIATTKSDLIKNRTLNSLSFCLINQNEYLIALENTNKGIALALKIKDTLGVAYHYMNMGLINQYYQSDYQSANNYFLKAKEIIEKKGSNIDLISIYSNIGTLRRMQGDFHQALYFLNKSLKLTEPNKAGVLLNNISLVYNDLGDYTRALDYLFKSLNIARKQNDKINTSLILGNIGLNYYNRKDYANALIYFKQSLALTQETNNRYQIALMLNNIATSWIESKQNYDQALIYLKQSSDLFIEIGDKVGLAMTYINNSDVYKSRKEYDKALEWAKKSREINLEIGDEGEIAGVTGQIGRIYFMMNNFKNAHSYGHEGLNRAVKIKHLAYMRYCAELVSQADSALGDYKSAFEHHKLYKQYSDSLHNEDKAKEFGRIESKFQFEKEAEEAQRKEEVQAKIEAEATARRDNLQYLTIFAGIIGLFAGLVFMGKFRIPTRILDVAVFAGLLILFEFLLILFDPLFEKYSGGIPFYKLGFNTIVAFAFAPLHGFLEDKLKKRLMKSSS